MSMATQNNNKEKGKGVFQSLDWFTILIYLILLAMGWMSVCGASYDFEETSLIFKPVRVCRLSGLVLQCCWVWLS